MPTRNALRHNYRHTLPYGIWHIPTGRQVLFNRLYKPLWTRTLPHSPAQPADPNEWVQGTNPLDTTHFYSDRNPPWQNPHIAKWCQEVLVNFINNVEMK